MNVLLEFDVVTLDDEKLAQRIREAVRGLVDEAGGREDKDPAPRRRTIIEYLDERRTVTTPTDSYKYWIQSVGAEIPALKLLHQHGEAKAATTQDA